MLSNLRAQLGEFGGVGVRHARRHQVELTEQRLVHLLLECVAFEIARIGERGAMPV